MARARGVAFVAREARAELNLMRRRQDHLSCASFGTHVCVDAGCHFLMGEFEEMNTVCIYHMSRRTGGDLGLTRDLGRTSAHKGLLNVWSFRSPC